jgi:hypothetical protein
MKAVLNGEYAGSGGKQYITIKGDLSVEGLKDVEELTTRVTQLEAHIARLGEIVSRLQEQHVRTNSSQLAKALEEIKSEAPAEAETEVPVEVSSQQEEPVVKTTSKKKQSSST